MDKDSDHLPKDVVVESTADASWKDCRIHENMPTKFKQQVAKLLNEFGMIFLNLPGKTNLIEHHIEVVTETPIRVKPYPIPVHYLEQVNGEINELQKLGIITRSYYCSPIVIIRKKYDTLGICVDYRKLNDITIPDAEPVPNVNDLFVTLAHSKIFSKLDMAKGYYQSDVQRIQTYD